MGKHEVNSQLLIKHFNQSLIRLLIIDDNQIRYNQIVSIFEQKNLLVQAQLLDDKITLEKQLYLNWDLIIFGRAYDVHLEEIIKQTSTPILSIKSEDQTLFQDSQLIQLGVYDLVNLDFPEQSFFALTRALSFSRLQQSQFALEKQLNHNLKVQENWIEEHKKAVVYVEEGIVIDVNNEFTKLFGFNCIDEIIGLPLLDVIQPNDVADFKSRFKKLTQGKFEFGTFDVQSNHAILSSFPILRFESSPTSDANIIQITISASSELLLDPLSDNIALSPEDESIQQTHPKIHYTLSKILKFLDENPANENALVVFSLANCPDQILNSDWNTFKEYFEKLSDFILEQTNGKVFKIEMALYATIVQAESIEILKSRLSSLLALEKPRLFNLGDQTYQQCVRLGYSLFNKSNLVAENFEQLIADAYNTRLPNLITHTAQLDATLEEIEEIPFESQTVETPENALYGSIDERIVDDKADFKAHPVEDSILNRTDENHADILMHLRKVLEREQITLKYQQIHDKNDQNLNTYEVTSGFIFENQWIKLSEIEELEEDPELSIKIDRWILVEAAKQLHNFLTQYPEAKLIINLRHHILFKHEQLSKLVSKLLTIIGAKVPKPLILQFEETVIAKNYALLLPAFESVIQHGADISIKDFGASQNSGLIIQNTPINNFALHESFNILLDSEKGIEEFQQKLQSFMAYRPVQFLLKNLDDMNSFATAWSVDARFLQGDYFQKKLDHLSNVQDAH